MKSSDGPERPGWKVAFAIAITISFSVGFWAGTRDFRLWQPKASVWEFNVTSNTHEFFYPGTYWVYDYGRVCRIRYIIHGMPSLHYQSYDRKRCDEMLNLSDSYLIGRFREEVLYAKGII